MITQPIRSRLLFASLVCLAGLASVHATAESYGIAKPAPETTAPAKIDFLDLTEEEMFAQLAGVRGTRTGLVNLPIRFDNGSTNVNADIVNKLVKLANVLSLGGMATVRMSIEGHANATGTRELNQGLTEQRANRVMQILVQRYGVAAGRLEARGFGFDQLLPGLNPTDPANRRVELRILNPQPTP